MTDEHASARGAHSRARNGAPDVRGYPALTAEDETEATLAAAPPGRGEKKPKPSEPQS